MIFLIPQTASSTPFADLSGEERKSLKTLVFSEFFFFTEKRKTVKFAVERLLTHRVSTAWLLN